MNQDIFALIGLLLSISGFALATSISYTEFKIANNRLRRQWSVTDNSPKNTHRRSQRQQNTSVSTANIIYLTVINHIKQQRENTLYCLSVVALLVPTILFIKLTPTITLALWIVLGTAVFSYGRPLLRELNARLNRLSSISQALPTEIEKLGIYLGAGNSIAGAIKKLAESSSQSTRDLFQRLENSLNSGIDLNDTLKEISQTFPIASVQRLASALESSIYGADLPRVIRQEASSQRTQLHRGALALMEKNSQKIWIPITIAALVPGIILIFIPFLAVMKQVTGS